MNKLPVFPGNKKAWTIFNKLIFGEQLSCPVSGTSLRSNYRLRYLWCSVCRKKYRYTSYRGSWLYGMKISSAQLYRLLWAWQQRKSIGDTRQLAGISYPTVARWFETFRLNLPKANQILSGVVRVDESYFGRQRFKQGQVLVVGAIDATSNQLRLDLVKNRHRDSLEPFVEATVENGSLVVSDSWWAYEELPLLGCLHEQWNHSKGQYAGTNRIEAVWSEMKRHMRRLYNFCLRVQYLPGILREWEARHNLPELFTSPEAYLRKCLFHVS